MRAFFCKDADNGGQWRIATSTEVRKIEGLTILNVPTDANDALLLEVVKVKNPNETLLTYTELMS